MTGFERSICILGLVCGLLATAGDAPGRGGAPGAGTPSAVEANVPPPGDFDRLLRESAVRLAAIDRQRFEITHFLSADDIRRSPDAITQVFPPAVCKRIRAKLGLG